MVYLVGTPIGNLGDISPRVAKTLASVDFIAAEDTRVSLKLLNHLNIRKPLIAYHDHNRHFQGAEIVRRLQEGETAALITDAGLPGISDPGEDLVRLCIDSGVEIQAISGPSACLLALILSGLSTGRFCFEGFLSVGKRSRMAHLAECKTETRTMIFYEAPHKLQKTLCDMFDVWGDRRISISRELTKKFEETRRFMLSEAITYYENPENKPRGEFVLVLEGAVPIQEVTLSMDEARERVEALTVSGYSQKDAIRQTAEELGIAKNALYREMIQ